MAAPLDDIFTIRVRKCKRCGGLLTSSDAIRDGYGRTCKLKMRQEEREAELAAELAKDQFSFFEEADDHE